MSGYLTPKSGASLTHLENVALLLLEVLDVLGGLIGGLASADKGLDERLVDVGDGPRRTAAVDGPSRQLSCSSCFRG